MLNDEGSGSAVPPVEEDNLLLTFADAMELAEEGDVAGGKDLLEGGLCRAADFSDEGEPWGDTLVARYREALARYAEQYQTRAEP